MFFHTIVCGFCHPAFFNSHASIFLRNPEKFPNVSGPRQPWQRVKIFTRKPMSSDLAPPILNIQTDISKDSFGRQVAHSETESPLLGLQLASVHTVDVTAKEDSKAVQREEKERGALPDEKLGLVV